MNLYVLYITRVGVVLKVGSADVKESTYYVQN